MKVVKGMVGLLAIEIVAAVIFIASGVYDISADAPHWKPVSLLITALRERSVESRADTIKVPSLDNPALVAEGAGHYQEMCAGCHLAPGMDDSEIRQGLYPQPPDLTQHAPDPAEAFQVIKHGIKMTGMPAWGTTHDDQKLWAVVAFLQKLPHMDKASYQKLVSDNPPEDD